MRKAKGNIIKMAQQMNGRMNEIGMITIAICDDKETERKRTAELCRAYLEKRKEQYRLYEYESGEAFLENRWVDILILDIKMKQIDGICLKEMLQSIGTESRIFYVSDDRDMMKEAFGKNVFGFLEKPVDDGAFCEKMDRVMEDVRESRSYFFCREVMDFEKIYRKVYLKEVVWVEAQGHKTMVYTESEPKGVLSELKISDWKGNYVKAGFVCCHRSYVVNLRHVVRIGQDLELTGGIRVPLAKERRKEFCKAVREYQRKVSDGRKNF